MKIIFSCDIDWSSERVIEDTIGLFEKYQIKCTLFVTHKSKSIDLCNRNLFEIGIHPNFNENIVKGVGLPAHENVKNLIRFYPEAKGVRSHSITSSGPLLEIFKKKALYIYIREMTDCETPQLTRVISVLKEDFYSKFNILNEEGLISVKSL